jgi:hypothetical protein
MGYIKEPAGIDFTVDPTPLTNEDRKKLSEIIAYYKATGQKMPLKKPATRTRLTTKSKNISKIVNLLDYTKASENVFILSNLPLHFIVC